MDVHNIKTIPVQDLQPGDEFWGDKPFKHDNCGFEDSPAEGDYMYYRVLFEPISSVNTSLFDGDGDCIVVPCEYADGAHGSRLFDTQTVITIRRERRDEG